MILILALVFWISKPKSILCANLSGKKFFSTLPGSWYARVSRGCDCKNTDQGLEAKIKINNCI